MEPSSGLEVALGPLSPLYTRYPGKCLARSRLLVFDNCQSRGRQAFELLKRLSVDFQRTSNSDGNWGWQVTQAGGQRDQPSVKEEITKLENILN